MRAGGARALSAVASASRISSSSMGGGVKSVRYSSGLIASSAGVPSLCADGNANFLLRYSAEVVIERGQVSF